MRCGAPDCECRTTKMSASIATRLSTVSSSVSPLLVDRGGRELPIEATYAGARVAVARDLSLVLSRADDGRLALATEPAGGAGEPGGSGDA